MLEHFTEADVKDAVEALPEQFRMAVLLADVEGFSYKEIAEILDIPIGTVMSRLHRGRKALQKTLHDFGMQRGLVAPAAGEPGFDLMRRADRQAIGRWAGQLRRVAGTARRRCSTLYHFLDGELTDRARGRRSSSTSTNVRPAWRRSTSRPS